MHRFFLTSEDQIFDNFINIRNKDLIHQFKNVLKFRKNEQIAVIDDKQIEYITEIIDLNPKNYKLQILKKQQNNFKPSFNIHLFFSLLKKQEKIELILQKCTEIGVSAFTPIITERTEKKSLGKIPRLERIIKEAAEQSGRTTIPPLHEVKKLKAVIKESENQINLIPHPKAKSQLSEITKKLNPDQTINIFIGPEGGFTENEITYFKENSNFQLFSLGKQILRTETAAIITPALILLNQ